MKTDCQLLLQIRICYSKAAICHWKNFKFVFLTERNQAHCRLVCTWSHQRHNEDENAVWEWNEICSLSYTALIERADLAEFTEREAQGTSFILTINCVSNTTVLTYVKEITSVWCFHQYKVLLYALRGILIKKTNSLLAVSTVNVSLSGTKDFVGILLQRGSHHWHILANDLIIVCLLLGLE